MAQSDLANNEGLCCSILKASHSKMKDLLAPSLCILGLLESLANVSYRPSIKVTRCGHRILGPIPRTQTDTQTDTRHFQIIYWIKQYLTALRSFISWLSSISWHAKEEKPFSVSTRKNTCGKSLSLSIRLQPYTRAIRKFIYWRIKVFLTFLLRYATPVCISVRLWRWGIVFTQVGILRK